MTYHLIDGLGGQWLAETTSEYQVSGHYEDLEPLGKVDDLLDKAALSGTLAKQLARARAAYIDADALRRINRLEGNFAADQLERWKQRASDRFAKLVNDENAPVEPRS